MTDPIVHFEIPADNVKRAQSFYSKTFGWTFKHFAPMDYYTVKAKNKKGEGIDGGMMKRMHPGQPFMNYVTVASVDAALAKVKANGGMVAMPKTPIGDMGAIAAFKDTEGNLMGLHEMSPKMAAKPGAKKSAKAQPAAKGKARKR